MYIYSEPLEDFCKLLLQVWFSYSLLQVLTCSLYASLRCKYVHDMYVNDVSEALMSSDNDTTVKK